MTTDNRSTSVKQGEGVSPDAYATDMRELTVFFQMIIEQITLMLQESGKSVDAMTESMTSIAAKVSSIKAHVTASKSDVVPHPDSSANVSSKGGSEQSQMLDAINSLCVEAEANLDRGVIAIQFYDRLSQRLSHVQENLHALSEITSAQQIDHTALWRQLHTRMQAVYTLEQEQRLYAKLLARLPIDEATLKTALNRAQERTGRSAVDSDKPPPHGDIELF